MPEFFSLQETETHSRLFGLLFISKSWSNALSKFKYKTFYNHFIWKSFSFFIQIIHSPAFAAAPAVCKPPCLYRTALQIRKRTFLSAKFSEGKANYSETYCSRTIMNARKNYESNSRRRKVQNSSSFRSRERILCKKQSDIFLLDWFKGDAGRGKQDRSDCWAVFERSWSWSESKTMDQRTPASF